ncbi:MAG: HD domain-containing protein [Actinomycetota bacterium]|nr:HD domain-containing protein [Actinomycetota bacterium]
MPCTVADYVHSLELDAYLVGGGVRDELLGLPVRDLDFVVPGVGQAELRAALEPHGRVEDLIVGDQRVGVRLHPRDREVRALQPGGIEFTPPRVERSTGPGRHDFEIVADAGISLEDDMRRRDFTINAIARSLETNEILDPLGGRADLRAGILRTTGPTSFRDDPLRIVRGLRFVSQLSVDPDEDTLRQMREWAPQIVHVSGERIGGGLAADGMGELSKLLLGAQPAKSLRLARDTDVLLHLLPEFEPTIGYAQQSERQHLTLDEHVFAVVQAAADAGDGLEVRLATLLHDLGKPDAERDGGDHAAIGAAVAGRVLSRLRYPTRLRDYVVKLVREHPFDPQGEPAPVDARRFLARHGERLAFDLIAHRAADLAGKTVPQSDWDWLGRFRELVEQERTQPHRLADLKIDGADLIEAGFEEGPALGRVLHTLLGEVVEDPERNRREELLSRARELA